MPLEYLEQGAKKAVGSQHPRGARMLITVMPRLQEIDRIGESPIGSGLASGSMVVPGRSGWVELRITMGIPARTSGRAVAGWRIAGTECGQLGSLLIARSREGTRRWDDAGIGRHQPVHVGPDLHPLRLERGTQNSRGEVGPTPAEGRRYTGGGGADEALGHRYPCPPRPGAGGIPRARVFTTCRCGSGPGEAVVGDQDRADVHPVGLDPGAGQRRGNEPGAPELSPARNGIELRQGHSPAVDAAELPLEGLGVGGNGLERRSASGELACDLLVPLDQRADRIVERGIVSRLGPSSQSEEHVGYPGQGGDDDHRPLGDSGPHDVDQSLDGRRVGH